MRRKPQRAGRESKDTCAGGTREQRYVLSRARPFHPLFVLPRRGCILRAFAERTARCRRTITGAFIAIWMARVPRIRARSYLQSRPPEEDIEDAGTQSARCASKQSAEAAPHDAYERQLYLLKDLPALPTSRREAYAGFP